MDAGQVSPRTATGVNAAPWSAAPVAPDYGALRHGTFPRAHLCPGLMPRPRIALCYGTRPQVIKASVLRAPVRVAASLEPLVR